MEEVGLGFEVSLDNNKKRVINRVCGGQILYYWKEAVRTQLYTSG